MRTMIILFALLMAATAYAGDSNGDMQQEIDHLFDYLARSECRFYRNGEWYDAEAAVAHIDRKYDYLNKRGLIDSTEHFIERAASESSLSGNPYLVQCGDAEPQKSSAWFKKELSAYRKGDSRNPRD